MNKTIDEIFKDAEDRYLHLRGVLPKVTASKEESLENLRKYRLECYGLSKILRLKKRYEELI